MEGIIDIEGKELFSGDTVEVVVEEDTRAGNPTTEFCSVGKRGKVIAEGWNAGVEVEFETPRGSKKVGCYMKNLKKISA